MVELAGVLPTVMLLALGCADFGRVFYYQSAVVNAARAGAQVGATNRRIERSPQPWHDRVENAARQEMEGVPNFNAAELVVSIVPSVDSRGLQVSDVTVQYKFRTIIEWPGTQSVVNLSHQVVMRQFR